MLTLYINDPNVSYHIDPTMLSLPLTLQFNYCH